MVVRNDDPPDPPLNDQPDNFRNIGDDEDTIGTIEGLDALETQEGEVATNEQNEAPLETADESERAVPNAGAELDAEEQVEEPDSGNERMEVARNENERLLVPRILDARDIPDRAAATVELEAEEQAGQMEEPDGGNGRMEVARNEREEAPSGSSDPRRSRGEQR